MNHDDYEETHEEKVIGRFWAKHRMAEIEATALTDHDEMLARLRGADRDHVDALFEYIMLQKALIEDLAGQVPYEPRPIAQPDFYPMSTTARKRY